MNWLGAATVAIRESSPTRVIAIGGPGYNPADTLLKYVTPKYLNYKLPDGTGFEGIEAETHGNTFEPLMRTR